MPLSKEAAYRKDRTAAPYRRLTGGKPTQLQHRHFAAIAAIIAELDDPEIKTHIATHFASRLQASNPRFDAARFLRACGSGD